MANSITNQALEHIQNIGDEPHERVDIVTDASGTTIRIGAAGSGLSNSLMKLTRIRRVLTSLPYVIDPANQAFVDINGLTLNSTITVDIIGEKILT